jgi:ATP-binding cassette subfamily B multidrug efflux pump
MADNNADIKVPRMGGPKVGGMQRFMHEKPKDTKGTLWRLLKIYSSQGSKITIAIILTLIGVGVTLSFPYLIGEAVDAFHVETQTVDMELLSLTLSLLVIAYLLDWLISTIKGLLMTGVSQNLVKSMRRSMFSKLQKLPLKFYDTHSHGDTMSRLTNDIDNISSSIAQTTTELASSLLTVIGSFVMMLILSPLLTLAALITVPLIGLLTRVIAKRGRKYFSGQQRTLGELNGIIEESIFGFKMVKAFNQEERTAGQFREINEELRMYSTKAQIWSGFLMPLMNVINNLSFACVACFGGVLSVWGTIGVGTIASFITYSRQFGRPLNNIAGMFNSIQSSLAGAERVFAIMDELEETPDLPDAQEGEEVRGDVEFQDVCFSYDGMKPVLDHISFHIPPGSVVALVGETGAGKTTIVNLLTRFYDTDSGEILVDGIPIQQRKRDDLRKCFSVVLQDTSLFTGTIAENIRYANPSASEEEVRHAAALANADPFIMRLPKGYDTVVTGNSDSLSTGERQLLSISRAFLCKAPILILDEATSSVDTRTEKQIQTAMLTLMKGRTSFLIAHRLSTIRDADIIMVVGNGTILERGTHAELMAQKGSYYKMVISQMGMEIDRQSEEKGTELA